MVDLRHGDCLDVLRSLPDASVDAVVTDPPYGLSDHRPDEVSACLAAWLKGEQYRVSNGKRGFMGKPWDAWVPGPEVWKECLRVLKPGGHILAFAGTRSMDLMCMAIRLSGFELRDSIGWAHDGGGAPLVSWTYGSGFPKSLDVSKAIDRMDASEEQERRRLRFTAWVRGTGATSRQIDEATGTTMGGHYTAAASQPAIMTREHLEQCRHLLGDVPEWVEREADIRSVESRNMASRQVIGSFRSSLGGTVAAGERDADFIATHKERIVFLTAPATDAARQWQGWGTALKPAWEPIILARKPLQGTVAENVLAHGTGAINVDGCRVGVTDAAYARNCSGDRGHAGTRGVESEGATNIHAGGGGAHDAGRWPANVIHDGSEEVVGLFPQSTSGANPTRRGGMGYHGAEGQESCDAPRGAESGSAARFFYSPKASKRDRDEGLDGFAIRSAGEVTGGRKDGSAGLQSPRAGAGRTNGARNIHPTVKPTDLMRYLCRLVTPPGGLVLDPFMGSGSTGKAAVLEGFRFIGIEREAEYVEIARARIEAVTPATEEPTKAPALDDAQLSLWDAP